MSFEDDVRRQTTAARVPADVGEPPSPQPPSGGVSFFGVFFAVLAALLVWKHCGRDDAPAATPAQEIRR